MSPASGGEAPANITVDTTEDDFELNECTAVAGDCSLRGALEGYAFDNHIDGRTIDITVPAGTYALLDEIRVFRANVNVHGAGVGETIVTTDLTGENNLVRHLELIPEEGEVDVTLSDMTFRDGFQGTEGGSIRTRGGVPLTILRMHFLENEVRGDGGAIAVQGELQAQTLLVEDTTFAGNTATEHGGAVYVGDSETAIISNSTFTGNVAAAGGAVAVGQIDPGDSDGLVRLNHVTMSGNASAGFQGDGATTGGSLFVGPGSEASIQGSILESSEEGEVAAPVAVGDPAAECYVGDGGVLESQGHNVVDDDSCSAAEEGDQEGVAAGAQALADNGGPTDTMALLADSPAVDAAGTTCDLADDQRGVERPQDGNDDGTNGCDAGAFELAAEEEPPAAQPAQETPDFTG